MAAGEGLEPSVSDFKDQRVASYTIPHETWSGQQDSRPASRADLALAAYKTAALPLCYAPKLVAVEGVEPSSDAYQAYALPLSYTAMDLIVRVGFEPTIPRLKGECLKPLGYRTRNGCNGKDSRPSHGRINSAMSYRQGLRHIKLALPKGGKAQSKS